MRIGGRKKKDGKSVRRWAISFSRLSFVYPYMFFRHTRGVYRAGYAPARIRHCGARGSEVISRVAERLKLSVSRMRENAYAAGGYTYNTFRKLNLFRARSRGLIYTRRCGVYIYMVRANAI